MNIISISDIVECNKLLREQGIMVQVHLRDACGRQSCYIEPLDETACEGQERLYEFLEAYFGKKRLKLEFDEERLNFWLMG